MSLLRPGKVSKFIADLRDKSVREASRPEAGTSLTKPKFEVEHKVADVPEYNQDDNGVSQFPGIWDPWVGNGRLPW